MRRGARRSARLLAAAMTAALAASHSMAEEEAYPVWWSPALELESLGDIDERLARRTLDFTVYKGKGGGAEERACRQLQLAQALGGAGLRSAHKPKL